MTQPGRRSFVIPCGVGQPRSALWALCLFVGLAGAACDSKQTTGCPDVAWTDCSKMPPVCGCDYFGCIRPQFKIDSGEYAVDAVTDVSDGCGLGVSVDSLSRPRRLVYDSLMGTLSISRQDPSQILLTGIKSCDSSDLSYGPQHETDGSCVFQSQRTGRLLPTVDNAATLTVSETRSNFTRVLGMTCNHTMSCTLRYTLSLRWVAP